MWFSTNKQDDLTRISCNQLEQFGKIDVNDIEPSDSWKWHVSFIQFFHDFLEKDSIVRNCKYFIKPIPKYLIYFAIEIAFKIGISNYSVTIYRKAIHFKILWPCQLSILGAFFKSLKIFFLDMIMSSVKSFNFLSNLYAFFSSCLLACTG